MVSRRELMCMFVVDAVLCVTCVALALAMVPAVWVWLIVAAYVGFTGAVNCGVLRRSDRVAKDKV